MLHTTNAERRASVRVPGNYLVQVWDGRGRRAGCGRTANISERGVYVLLAVGPRGRNLATGRHVEVEISLPRSPVNPRLTRTVRYRAQVVRCETMGRWQGVALELLEKLA